MDLEIGRTLPTLIHTLLVVQRHDSGLRAGPVAGGAGGLFPAQQGFVKVKLAAQQQEPAVLQPQACLVSFAAGGAAEVRLLSANATGTPITASK